MTGVMEESNGSRLLPPADLLTRVARLVLHEEDLDRLDELSEAVIELLQRVQAQRRAVQRARPAAPGSPPIEWLSAKEVAALLHRSESTIRHLPPDAIPGRRQQAKGCKVAWNKQILMNWLAEGYR